MQIDQIEQDPMSDSGPDEDSSSSDEEEKNQQERQTTYYAHQHPRQSNIHPSSQTTLSQPSQSAPGPEDHVKLRRDRKQRDFLFAGADEEELDRLLGSNKRKRRSNEHDDDDSEEELEGKREGIKKGKAGRKKGGSAESKGDGRVGERGGGGGKGREVTKDLGRTASGFKATRAPRHCWTQSDEDKVLRWAEKYVAKSRTNVTMKEYAKKHLKHTFLDRTMESTYSKFKKLVSNLSSTPRTPVASSSNSDSRRKEEVVELEAARTNREEPEKKKKKKVLRRRDRSLSPVVVQNQQQHQESEFELEASPAPASSMDTDKKRRMIEELAQQQHARTLSMEWFKLGGAKIERPSMGSGSASLGSSSFPVPPSTLVPNPPAPSTSSSRIEPSTSTGFPRTLKLRNFDHLVKDDDLRNLVSSFGRVVSAQVMRDPAGHSLGLGIVEFERGDDAQAAMERLSGTRIRNRPLSIIPAPQTSPSSAPRVAAPPLLPSSFRYGYDSYRSSLTDANTLRSPSRGPSQPMRDPRDLPISSVPSTSSSSSSAVAAVPTPPATSLDTLATLTAALHANPSSLLSLVLNPAQPAAQSLLALLASTSNTANFTTTSTASTYAPSLRTDTDHFFTCANNPSYGMSSSSAPRGSTSHTQPSSVSNSSSAFRDSRMVERSDVSSGRR